MRQTKYVGAVLALALCAAMTGCASLKALHSEAKTPVEEAFALASEAKGALLVANIVVKDKSVPPQAVIVIQKGSQALSDALTGLDQATAAYEQADAAIKAAAALGQAADTAALSRASITANALRSALTNIKPLITSLQRDVKAFKAKGV